VQRLLIGVLDSGRFTRLNGTQPLTLNARVLSSAQPDIEHRGAEGFRRDLLAQLNALIVRVPPLREYAEDVPELLRHYVDRAVDTEGCRSDASASPRRTGCAIIHGLTMFASCGISCSAS
jgi:two-component system nitrogen regulation response regulator NtrX